VDESLVPPPDRSAAIAGGLILAARRSLAANRARISSLRDGAGNKPSSSARK
jgi:hypothetical protein